MLRSLLVLCLVCIAAPAMAQEYKSKELADAARDWRQELIDGIPANKKQPNLVAGLRRAAEIEYQAKDYRAAVGRLRSAIANAERKAEDAGASLDVDHLFVSRCFVNEGSRWKRLRPAPMGRAFRYQRRTAHIVVGVVEHHHAVQQRVAAAAAEAESHKGVKGAVKKARQALSGKKKQGGKTRK